MGDVLKERLDVLLVKKGLAASREKAKAFIMSGIVYVDSQKEDKAGSLFDENSNIEIRGETLKFDGFVCLDIGASTGGFTDCMLQNGATKVYSVDVGHGQLDWKLRNDDRVICMEKCNFRYVTDKDITEKIDFAATDVSFISLTKILIPAYNLLKQNAGMICLIKPQFETTKEKVGKKGVVRDPKVHEEVIEKILDFCIKTGFDIKGLDYSPIKGPEGNIEYLLYIQKSNDDFIDEDKTLAINDNKELSDLSGYLDIIKNTVIKSHEEHDKQNPDTK